METETTYQFLNDNFKSLANRFISDFNLPFAYIDFNHFKYCLRLFGYIDEWDNLMDIIYDKYDSNHNKFLDDYYQIRDNIIQDILSNKDYQHFINDADMSIYSVDKELRNIPSNNIYNRENIGKAFLSIDLKKANFQVLKHFSSAILKNAKSYEDFIGNYTDLDYVKKSKYTRQVIFGKCNPKRQITLEKYFTSEIYKLIGDVKGWNVVSLSNDEIVYQIDNESCIPTSLDIKQLEDYIKEQTDFDVTITTFILQGFEFQNMETGKCKFTFYNKWNITPYGNKLVSVPMPYYKMVYKMFNGIPLEDEDYLFSYEDTMCEFKEEFQIKKIEE